jgi:uncharacterized phage protein gp47/JayE
MENVPSLLTIYNRIKADMDTRLTGDTGIFSRAFLTVMAYVFAGAVHLVYLFIALIPNNFMPDTAALDWLKRLAVTWGVGLKSASPSRGTVSVTGLVAGGGTVYVGTSLEDPDGIEFVTTRDVVVPAGESVYADVEASVDGVSGNVDTSELLFVDDVSGQFETSAPFISSPVGGADEETEEALRGRVENRWANRPSSGSVPDLSQQCLDVEGVEYAWILPAEDYQGPGTAAAIIAGVDKSVVNPTVKAVVVAALDVKEVVGANTDVLDIDPIEMTIVTKITPYSDDAATSISQNITQLFIDEAEPNGIVKISSIRDAISSAVGSDGDYIISWIIRHSDGKNYDVNQNLPPASNPNPPPAIQYGQAYSIFSVDVEELL